MKALDVVHAVKNIVLTAKSWVVIFEKKFDVKKRSAKLIMLLCHYIYYYCKVTYDIILHKCKSRKNAKGGESMELLNSVFKETNEVTNGFKKVKLILMNQYDAKSPPDRTPDAMYQLIKSATKKINANFSVFDSAGLIKSLQRMRELRNFFEHTEDWAKRNVTKKTVMVKYREFINLQNEVLIRLEKGKSYSQSPKSAVSSPENKTPPFRTTSAKKQDIDIADGVDPVFSCILIDASGSMTPHMDDVIQSHRVMIDSLRKSSQCKNDGLYIMQYLFSDKPNELHGWKKLSSHKDNDGVVLLDSKNYDPFQGRRTALYDTVYESLQNLGAIVDKCYEDGVACTFNIAVITDGMDNASQIQPPELKELILKFRQKEVLRSALVFGLMDDKFSSNHINTLKDEMGFDSAEALGKDPKGIRRAFELASQSLLSN